MAAKDTDRFYADVTPPPFYRLPVFVDLLRASNTPMYLKTMDSLLQEDSQRILDIARHATVRDDASPEITFYAIRVLFHLSQVRVVLEVEVCCTQGGVRGVSAMAVMGRGARHGGLVLPLPFFRCDGV